MKRRITALFLAMAILCTLLPMSLLSASAVETSGTCGENLTWSFDEDSGTLTISGEGKMTDYSTQFSYSNRSITFITTAPWGDFINNLVAVVIDRGVMSIGANAFRGCRKLASITISNSVTSIGGAAFFDCSGLTSITIPDGVMSINWGAFEGCSSLTSVTIPESVTSIGTSVFSDCSRLTSITIPNSVTSIEDGTFSGCSGLTSVTIPEGVTNIGGSAFEGCSRLENITIPEGVTNIGESAFKGCSGLTSITIPDSVTNIGGSAFKGCSGLTSITIPDSVTNIGGSAFEGCSSLTTVSVNTNNPNYTSEDGVLYNKDQTELICCPCGKTGSLTIPDSVTSIGDSAFWGCTGLTSITIPDSVTSIGNVVFYGCTGLTSITIPDSVTSIGNVVFYDCSGLTSITIPDSVTNIGWSAFVSCSSLTSITIPDSVTNISDYAFSDCSSLTSVYFMGDAPEIGDGVFCVYDMETQTNIIIPDLMLYYIDGKEGWTSPTWKGYPTATWMPVHEHSYTDTVIAPTCTEQGYTVHTCKCSDSYIDTYIDALGHDYGDWTQTKAPTCTEKGAEKRTCSRCDTFETREIDALGHTEVVDAAVPATCTEAGKTEGKHCAACNTVLVAQKKIPALGHDFGDWTQTKAPTCTEKGAEKRVCSRCDTFETREIDALGHKYENGVCVQCGEKDPNEQPTIEFVDVPQKAWYVEAVNYAVRNGLMNGVGNDQFNPEGSMTRAMLVTVLWRYEGEPEAGKNTFSDVPNGQWYTKAVAWAAENGIVGGVGNNRFDPNGEITREQMATILFRYAEKKGIDTSKRGSLNIFSDEKQLSAYAKDAVQWAVAEQIINGSDGKLLPQGSATRAQVATILMRFIENKIK